MQTPSPAPGVQIADLLDDSAFARRHHHSRDKLQREEGLKRLARVFAERPERILQELADVALELCAADSAGISVEEVAESKHDFRWVATSGKYVPLQNATLPYDFAPCGICLARGRPQLFCVGQSFFDLLGVNADLVTDGMLIPWQVEDIRGTIWVVSHCETEAFDRDDYETVQSLADFATIAVRHQHLQSLLIRRARAEARASVVNELAHQINNPLQAITNLLFIESQGEGEAKILAAELAREVQRLTNVVVKLLVTTTLR